jgi:epsilon-lactone hydrolase
VPSFQARAVSTLVKLSLRRQSWGKTDFEVANYARSRLGSPKIQRWYKSLGLKVEVINEPGFCGEWITPPDSKAGVVLYFHGGGYFSCSAASHRPIASVIAGMTGMRVFSADYRLAPEFRFPAGLNDAFGVYLRLLEQGIGAAGIAVAGDSAGGGLVLSTILKAREADVPLPACAVCFSAWTDMTGQSKTVQSNNGRCAMFMRENMPEFARVYLGEESPVNPLVSQVFAEFQDFPPALFQVGSTELLLDDSRRVHEKLKDAGRDSKLEVFDDVPHCWQMFDGIIPESRVALRQASDFILEHLRFR